MTLKPPPPESGEAGLERFREAAKLYAGTLRNKAKRELYRKELARWSKLYASLARKRPFGSAAADHFARLSDVCASLLDEFGVEPPPAKRSRPQVSPTSLTYPAFPKNITHRIHFLDGPGIRRRRAAELSSYAATVSRQVSGSGRILLSIGVGKDDVRLFERIVEAIGDLTYGDYEAAGFDIGYVMRPTDVQSGQTWEANPLDPTLPIARIWNDNRRAAGYSPRARLLGELWEGGASSGLPTDLTEEVTRAWDPDPIWRAVLELTETDRLGEAMALVDTVHGSDRELFFGEVIYLRFLTGTLLRAQDIRFVARKHAEASLISGRLLDEFERYLEHLDARFDLDRPVLGELRRFRPDYNTGMIPPAPPVSDWAAFRRHVAGFRNPGGQRGRMFSVDIGIDETGVSTFLADALVAAENAFRRERAIPEIGRGWASEVALVDLVRTIWPSAIHQWRPAFLGMQSIDIYIPELELAIEYQGQQHYQPVTLFGGQEGFDLTVARDEKKRRILAHHGVRLLDWRFDVPITKSELARQVSAMGIAIPQA